MPQCKNCNIYFPTRATIDGKDRFLTRRKYCFTCSPFGKHNTTKLENNVEKPAGSCKSCGRNFEYKREKGHRRNYCSTCQQTKRREHIKKRCLDYKGSRCKICGYNRCEQSLVFHHLNPEEKNFGISGNTACKSWGKIQAELDKCVLVCMNCHGEIHYGLISNQKLLE